MVAVYIISTNPLSSFSFSFSSSSSSNSLSQALVSQATPSSVSSFSACKSHQWFPIVKTSLTGTTEQKPLLSLVGFRPSKHTIQYSSTSITSNNSSSTLLTEMVLVPGMIFTFFQEFGLDEKETEVLMGKNAALRFTSLDNVRTRILSLQALGINGFALSRLITKCPDVLTAPEVDSLISFIQDDLEGKLEPVQLERFLTSTEPRFLAGFDRKVRLLLRLGIPQEKIAHVLNNINLTKAICLKADEEIERTMTYLDRFGAIDIIVRRPIILNYDLDTQLIPKIGFLTELSGGDEDATGTVLRKLPAILTYSLEHLMGHVEFFRSFVGLTEEEIFKIFLVFPNVISASRKRKLHPRIEFLKECSLNTNDIFKLLTKAPLFLGLSFKGNLAYKLTFLVKIGYAYRTKELALAMGAVTRTSSENLQNVIGLFLNHGFSSEEILVMTNKHPQILQYKRSSLEEKMEYLTEEMGREVGELLSFPAFLGYKLDDRIKHRYEVRKEIIGEGMSINKLLSVSTERFSKKNKKKKSVQMVDA